MLSVWMTSVRLLKPSLGRPKGMCTFSLDTICEHQNPVLNSAHCMVSAAFTVVRYVSTLQVLYTLDSARHFALRDYCVYISIHLAGSHKDLVV